MPAISRVWDASRTERLSAMTLRRAKQELDIRAQRVWDDGRRPSYWLLPGQRLSEEVDPGGKNLEELLAPALAQFPFPTPLDEKEA